LDLLSVLPLEMIMVRIRFSELDEQVKQFLSRAQKGDTIVVEGEDGAIRFGVTPYVQASDGERQAALSALEAIQQRVAASVLQAGVTEVDIDLQLRD
jgi:thiamine monophosphate kinase